MPRFMRGIHVFAPKKKGVDGPDKPGHDELGRHLTKHHGHFTSGGIDDRIELTLPPVLRPKTVPRS